MFACFMFCPFSIPNVIAFGTRCCGYEKKVSLLTHDIVPKLPYNSINVGLSHSEYQYLALQLQTDSAAS